jgi:hypothetical protein
VIAVEVLMKTIYTTPEYKFVVISTEDILQTSKDKDPYVEDPFDGIV